jgi:hypothetical protein
VSFSYIRFDYTLTGSNAPFFTGSALRGAFGYNLKKVSCINPKGECDGCFAQSTCLYFDFFENKNISHKYRFDVTIPSSGWNFGLYLFEDACEKAAYVLSAMNAAITESGLGADRQKQRIVSVWANDVLVYDGNRYELKGVNAKHFTPQNQMKISKITIKTPFRLKSDSKRVAPEEITALSMALSAMRRLDELKGEPMKSRRFEYKRGEEKKSLEFVNLNRYSNRQKTKMGLGGYVGEIECADMSEEMANALRVGEILGVGKSCVFGLGKIKLEEVE